MSRWADAEAMRRYNGLPFEATDPNYEADSVLEYYLDNSQYAVRPDVMSYIRDDQISGSINGSNTEFYITNYPIADGNFDGSLNSNDVTVYGWGDINNFLTKTSLGVVSINAVEGRITMSSAPASTYDALTCDYYYSMYEINTTLLEQASAYLAGYTYFVARYMEVPMNVRIGAQAYKMESPAQKAWNAYTVVMSRIRTELIASHRRKGTRLRYP